MVMRLTPGQCLEAGAANYASLSALLGLGGLIGDGKEVAFSRLSNG